MWPSCGHSFQFRRHFWLLDQLKSCLIQLAIAFYKDCHFKIINSKVKSLLVHSLNDYIVGPLNCVYY